MKKFKISCSQIGKIMGGSIGLSDEQELKLASYIKRESDSLNGVKDQKGNTIKPLPPTYIEQKIYLQKIKDNPVLPKGAKTYAETWLKQQLYSRRKEASSKEMEKGIAVEDDAIDYVVDVMGLGFALKNEKRFNGDPDIEGEPDVILLDRVQDIKSSWDCFTFPLFDTKIDTDYYYQGQGYMELTGKRKFQLCYCLMDMPDDMIENEVRKASYQRKFENWSYDEVYEHIQKKHCYSGLPKHLRLKVYDVEYNESVIKEVRMRVKMIRAYIKDELIPQLPKGIIKEIESYKKAS